MVWVFQCGLASVVGGQSKPNPASNRGRQVEADSAILAGTWHLEKLVGPMELCSAFSVQRSLSQTSIWGAPAVRTYLTCALQCPTSHHLVNRQSSIVIVCAFVDFSTHQPHMYLLTKPLALLILGVGVVDWVPPTSRMLQDVAHLSGKRLRI